MIDTTHHFKLGTYLYKAQTSGDQEPYILQGKPLRPANAVTVVGEKTQKFQMRADVLMWNITDWSGGEGKKKFNFTEPGRSWQLNGVRAFSEPGEISPGYYVENTQDSTGAADFALSLGIAPAMDGLWGIDLNAANAYQWDITNKKWGAAVALVGPAAGANLQVCGDREAIYWIEKNTNNVWKYDGSNTTKISDTLITASGATYMTQLGSYVYVVRHLGGKVWEIPKSGAAGTLVDSWTETGNAPKAISGICVLDGKVYTMLNNGTSTAVREITPTTAAGPSFGAEIARVNGFLAEGIQSHAGMLYLVGSFMDNSTERTMVYLTPGGDNYGSLGSFRNGDTLGAIGVSDYGARMLDHFFTSANRSAANTGVSLWQIDAVSGGLACLGYDEVASITYPALGPVAFEGDLFFSSKASAATKGVWRARTDQYMKNASVVTPWHDFDLVDDKILASLLLTVDTMPTGWTVYVDYQKEGASSWTTAVTHTTGTGTKTTVSTNLSTIKFRSLRLRIRWAYTGGGIPTTAPTVLGVEVRSQVAKPQKVWVLALSLDDDHSGGSQNLTGSQKADNIIALAANEAVFAFLDGYRDRLAGNYTSYDVVIDSYRISMDRMGEGFVVVVLHEVA